MHCLRQRCLLAIAGVVALLLWTAGGSAAASRPYDPQTTPQAPLLSALFQARFPAPQKEEQAGPKTLVGQVVDQQGTGLAQAVVHLKNKKTLAVKTHISDEKGNYRFVGLDRDTDFTVHAEYRGASSEARNVSSFDDRREIYLVLEIKTSE